MSVERCEIDAGHSSIHFSVRHLVIAKVRGQFARWSGTVQVPDGDFAAAAVKVVVDASSIATGVADRDNHLRSADFLDVANHPEIVFQSTGVSGEGEDLRVLGDLTIRGVTRPIELQVEGTGRLTDPWGNERAGFTGKTSIDRKDFGLTWNQLLEAGGVMVGDRVNIEIEVEAVKQAVAKAA